MREASHEITAFTERWTAAHSALVLCRDGGARCNETVHFGGVMAMSTEAWCKKPDWLLMSELKTGLAGCRGIIGS